MRYLLLAAAAAAIPLPEHEADAFVSATFEGVAVAVPRFAIVTTLSAYRRTSFAFATVVLMRSCSMSCVTMVRIMAHLWLASLPSLRKCRPCFILRPSRAAPFCGNLISRRGGRAPYSTRT